MTESVQREPTVANLIAVFDVNPDGHGGSDGYERFTGGGGQFTGGGGGRNVIDGSQLLAQSIVAASKAFPGRTARSAHALFVAAARPGVPLSFTVAPVRNGRSFASAVVTVAQGDRTCVTATVLLDSPQPDVIRHHRPSGEPEASPDGSTPIHTPLPGRELRIVGVRNQDSPDEADNSRP
ncbi:MAG TPA: acyl-CoA thioesterase domain-containing protein [Trebonia sp.]|jgi:acyl-CoA thioesterase